MYQCQNCGKTTESREKQNKVATYRDKEYSNFRFILNEKTKRKEKEYFTTQGQEIVSELNYCNECYGDK